MEKLIPIILVLVMMVIFGMGAFMLYRYTGRNHLQKTLAAILVAWFVMFALLEVTMLQLYIEQTSPNEGVFQFRRLVSGLVGLFSLIAYYLVALHRRLMTVRNGLIYLSPVIFILLIYVGWHLATGMPMDYTYPTLEDFTKDITSIPALLRLLLLICYFIYTGFIIKNIISLTTLCVGDKRLCGDEMRLNIRWLWMILGGFLSISTCFYVIVLYPVSWAFFLYAVVAGVVFIYYIDNGMFRRMYVEPQRFHPEWSLRRGWYVVETPEPISKELFPKSPTQYERIEAWMLAQKPFTNPDFSSEAIYGAFPAIEPQTLNSLLSQSGYSVQSYIRHHRIGEACRIIEQHPERALAEVASDVGFTNASSFSRSFLAVKGMSPLEYGNNQTDKKGKRKYRKIKKIEIPMKNKKNLLSLFVLLVAVIGSAQAQQSPQKELPATNIGTTEIWQSERYIAVKTNLAAWAGTIMNVAADVQVGKHVSIELPVLWCPWYVSDRHAVRTFTIQPEARYWLSKPGRGHFFGLHAHVSWFNVKWNDNRYQDTDRPMLGAGISYGYLLPLSDHWGAEFTLGAGYANMKYDTYYNIENGVRFDTQTKNYWGITRVGISLVYRFNAAK